MTRWWVTATAVAVPGVLAVFAAIGGALLLPFHPEGSGQGESTEERSDTAHVLEAAKARIAEESVGGARTPAMEAAPDARHDGAMPRRTPTPTRTSTPTPPEGYAFVGHAGEMRKAAMMARGADDPLADGVPDWLHPSAGVPALAGQAAQAGRGWTFGWIARGAGTTRTDLSNALRGAGAEVVGAFGASGRLVRVRLPGDAEDLRAIAALDVVAGLGAAPPESKLAGFGPELPYGIAPVYVTLMAEDADGRWRRAMESLGAVVGAYDPGLRVYAANADRAVIEALAMADWVLAVEPIPVVRATHDTAVPAMGADALRRHDGAPGIFVGADGASVPVAVMDTGLNVRHPDIATHRDSICGANFVYGSRDIDPYAEDDDLWIDANGHGTHVTGTVAGNGFVAQRFAGMAPGVRHIRFAKVLSMFGSGVGDSVRRGMDFLSTASGCDDDAGVASERLIKPLIVNMSLSARALTHEGRGASARKLDAMVWSHRQLYVVAQGNSDIHSFSNYGAAKNSLAVGAAMDGGALAPFSSHGPTFDGRLAPNVVGTGMGVNSALGDGSKLAYRKISGTSMASPAVAGVAALLMDAAPAHQEHPALTRARLMASAIRPDPWLAEGGGFPLDNTEGPGPVQARFGMGKVSARTAVLQRDTADGWTTGSATAALDDGVYAWQDIDVPAGAHRLDLVMTWDEPPADALASTVLNDIDLWLDRDGDCGAAACGEHASRSRIDNVEWIVVRNPEPGTYRAKVAAHRVYTDAPRAALAWTVVRGPSTPTLSVEADRPRLSGSGEHELTLTLTADGYVAAGTRLHIDCRAEEHSICTDLVTIEGVTVSREDGIAVDLDNDAERPSPAEYDAIDSPLGFGTSIPVGEITSGERREVTLRIAVADDASAGASLHFTASAWNGRAGSAAVRVGSGSLLDIERPPNDRFAEAAAIEGLDGSVALDLLHATPEPGEPVAAPRERRPAGSVWYAWKAPSDGPFRFRVPAVAGGDEENGDIARYDRVQVFEGDAVSGLDEVAGGLWGATFFAAGGRAYRVRVANSSRGTPMDLQWSRGERPANDDFAAAAVLSGESGAIDGSSAGATLEEGESFGSLAATTWYRWTAPDDGGWAFRAAGQLILVFEGDGLGALRLVSGRPNPVARFPAGADREYHIAVAEADAYGRTGDYSLTWVGVADSQDNDAFSQALPIDRAASEQEVLVDRTATVQPGEPPETGVRTRWWAWEVPADGRYTWRVGAADDPVPTFSKLRVTLFRGIDLADLELAAELGPGPPYGIALDAVGGENYRIAVGVRNGDEVAFAYFGGGLFGRLSWGLTPNNDEPGGAAAVAGASGSVSGSTAFATGGSGERSEVLGSSTLWWTYEADASGWLRFAADGDGGPWRLVVHRESADGGLEAVAASALQGGEGDAVEVFFEAEEGVRYTISLGAAGGSGGDFTLRWDPTDAPTWLRYAGRLADGDRDARGNPVEIRGPADLAIHASGTALYLASELGLQVFGRDAASGELKFVQLLDTGPHGEPVRLLWDATRRRLLVDECGNWRSFAEVGDGPELEDLGAPPVEDDPGSCADELLMDGRGSHLYRLAGQTIEHFAVDDGGGLRFADAVDAGQELKAAVLSGEGGYLYASSYDRLLLFEREPDTGILTRMPYEGDELSWSRWVGFEQPDGQALAITDNDTHLFVLDRFGARVNLYSLDDPAEPDRLDVLERFWEAPRGSDYCRFADARSASTAVDVFCPGVAFAAQWDSEKRALAGTEFLGPGAGEDGRMMPPFAAPIALAAAPDDRHLYLATPRQGILVFARDAPAPAEEAGVPDLAIQRVWSSPAEPAAGSSFRLSALVRNRGAARSDGATLLFYRSGDGRISAADAEIGSVPLGTLAAAGTRGRSVEAMAPATPGTYHYGACVDPPGSGDRGGCSEAVRVTVTEAQPGAPDLVADTPSVDETNPGPGASFTLNVVVRNTGEARSPATKLRWYRSDNATVSTGDAEVGTDSVGALAAGADTDRSVTLTATSQAGAFWYGACVDRVPAESDTGNNCSDGVEVQVGGGNVGGGQDDDHGEGFADATPVAVPSTTPGDLEEGGDGDYFAFEIGATTTVTVETTGGTDTLGTLFDGRGTSLETDDDGGSGTNFRIERELRAGTYHVEVRGFHASVTGPYTAERARRRERGLRRPFRHQGNMSAAKASCGPVIDQEIRRRWEGRQRAARNAT